MGVVAFTASISSPKRFDPQRSHRIDAVVPDASGGIVGQTLESATMHEGGRTFEYWRNFISRYCAQCGSARVLCFVALLADLLDWGGPASVMWYGDRHSQPAVHLSAHEGVFGR